MNDDGNAYITSVSSFSYLDDKVWIHDDSLKYLRSFLYTCPKSYGGFLVNFKIKDGKAVIIE